MAAARWFERCGATEQPLWCSSLADGGRGVQAPPPSPRPPDTAAAHLAELVGAGAAGRDLVSELDLRRSRSPGVTGHALIGGWIGNQV